MTDARLPERWLNDIRLRKLTAPEFRTYMVVLLWCVANRTNGRLEADNVPFIPDADGGHAGRLVELNLWAPVPGGWIIVDFSSTQTSREQLEGLELKKQQDRTRSKNYRDRRKAEGASRDNSRDDIGQDRPGQDKQAFTTEQEKDDAWNVGLTPDFQPNEQQEFSTERSGLQW